MRDTTLQEFRNEVRDFCAAELPAELRSRVLLNQIIDKADYVSWQKALRQRGWFGGHWPVAYGGKGWSKLQQWVFEEALYEAGAPWLIPFGVTYVGPVIFTFGNEAQKQTFLPAILNSDVWWCQGYSEPNAGSDLASLTTRAVRDGDHYVLSGQKTWTTMAQWADMIFVLARTSSSGKPQDGISFFLVDLQSPGISIRPIKSIDHCHHLNEVFFDEVRVPASQLVGAENSGWTYAKFLLSQERLLAADVSKSRRMITRLVQLARQTGGTAALADDLNWRIGLAELEVEVDALEALCLEFLEAEEEGKESGPEVSMLKILGSELSQRISGMTIDVLGRHGLSYQTGALMQGGEELGLHGAAGSVREYLHGRATTIYGGSNEIQRNIIAKAVLGL
jgi:alkylation response protein AidB-like acyl-CoA dehydrogenase